MTAPGALLSSRLKRPYFVTLLLLISVGTSACQTGVYVEALVPTDYEVVGEDQYVCFRVELPPQSLKIVGVDPLSKQDVVHHMLLFGRFSSADASALCTWIGMTVVVHILAQHMLISSSCA